MSKKADKVREQTAKMLPEQQGAHRMLMGVARMAQSMRSHFTRLAYAGMDAADKAALAKTVKAAQGTRPADKAGMKRTVKQAKKKDSYNGRPKPTAAGSRSRTARTTVA